MARKSNTRTTVKTTRTAAPWDRLVEAVNETRIRLLEFDSLLPVFAAAWFTFATLELALQAMIPPSALRNEDLPIGARFFLICYSIASSTIFLFVICGFFMLLSWLRKRFLTTRPAFRWITGVFAVFLTWLILLLYGASWGAFWQTGSFIDSQAFMFLAPHPLQVFHWVDADLALTLTALSLGATFATAVWLPSWIARSSVMTQRRLVLSWAAAFGLCLLGSFLGELYSGTEQRRYSRAAILYAKTRDNKSGPFSYVLTDIRRRLRNQTEDRIKADDIRIIQRPIISIKEYLAAAARSSIKRRNVIVIVVESLRADQLRAYGANRDVMTTVDALARESRVFLRTYSQSSHTNYATATPLSSHYPLRSATSYTYPEKASYPRLFIYDVLKAIGYHTAIFSSSNEYWGGMIYFLETGNIDYFLHAANFKGPTYVLQGDAGFADWTRESQHAGSIDDRYTVNEAIRWIDGLKGGPFFMAFNFQSSHIPYMVPNDFPRRFGPAKLDFTIRFAHFPRNKVDIVKDVYADSLAYVDSQIARLFEHLKRKGVWDDTVVVLTSDHGQAFYEHGFASHASAIFDEVMKVPLIIRAPGLKPGLENGLAQHVDIAPSVLGLLGLPVHPSFQGVDLLNSRSAPNRSIYLVAQTPLAYQYGIIRSGMKLIYDERERQYSLYDLTSDPGETRDIAASQPELRNELAKRLQTWRTLQIDYYTDKQLQAREYPPVLAD